MTVATAPEEQGTRLRILHTAARLFRARGYAATSLRAIASATGIQAGSVYNHFSSKEAIVTELLNIGVRTVFDRVRSSTEQAARSGTGADVLRAAILAHLTALLGEDNFTSANIRIFAHVPPHVRDATLTLRHAYEDYWVDVLKRCVGDGGFSNSFEVKSLSMYLFGCMNWTLEWYRSDRHSIEQIADEIATLFIAAAIPAPVETLPVVGSGQPR